MNTLIGNDAIPEYYDQLTARQNNQKDPANALLFILWADPALIPIKLN